MSTVLVFCPNLIGDAVMATPAVRSLSQGFPAARMIAVAKPGVVAALEGAPWFADFITFDPRSPRAEEQTPAVLRRLQGERADVAVLFPNSFRSAFLAWRAGASRRVGYARGGRGLFLTDRLDPPRDDRGAFRPVPIVDYYREIPRHLGCPDDGPRLELFTTRADEDAAKAAWNRLGLPESGPVVCLNTGGAFGPAKAWPVDHFAELARRLVDEASVGVLVLCGPAERDAAQSIVDRANRAGVVSLADQALGIGLTKACIRRSALLVTTDSGPRHFATAFDLPTISLFGPTRIEWTLTYHRKALHLHHPVPCGPCQLPSCPERHHRCLRELAPDAVFRAAITMLGASAFAGERIEAV
jgi:heptosyltransferase-2